MGGLFGGGGRRAPTEAEKEAEKAQARQEERAQAQETSEMQGAQQRRRLRRTGGMRLLFSPQRLEEMRGGTQTKLGGDR
jgi:hypothetical protein